MFLSTVSPHRRAGHRPESRRRWGGTGAMGWSSLSVLVRSLCMVLTFLEGMDCLWGLFGCRLLMPLVRRLYTATTYARASLRHSTTTEPVAFGRGICLCGPTSLCHSALALWHDGRGHCLVHFSCISIMFLLRLQPLTSTANSSS